MKKLLMCIIMAMLVALLFSASSVSANPGLGVDIEPEIQHTSPGKMVEYTITVFNYDSADKLVAIDVDAWKCKVSWFGWTGIDVPVLANSVKSVSITVTPDSSTAGGEYKWRVIAATPGDSGSATATLDVQDYDYLCETYVEGEGVFYIDKKVRSSTGSGAEQQRFSVNVEKHFECRGDIDGFVLDEYLTEDALGDNPNFKQVSAVEDYRARATVPGDHFIGDEQLKSSFVFGGTGAKIHEHYNVQEMDARLESVNLHSTGDERHKTELDTYNEFSGYFLIDAEQSIPGYKHIEDRQEFLGNFTVSKRLIFRRPDIPIFDWP